MFEDFDKSIKEKIKYKDCGYAGVKPNTEDWVDLPEFDPDFNDQSNNIYNDPNIPETDDYTLEVWEYTDLNIELAIPRDSDGP